MSNLPQQNTINQYVADGITTIYAYTFLILEADSLANDIAVYVTPAGQTPSQSADLQPLNTAYTVQDVGNLTGGTITFQPGYVPALTSVVTIVRQMSVSIDTNFSNAQNFNGANLDAAFERVVLIMQQLNTYYMHNALSYIINTFLPVTGSNFLPPLPDNYTWVGQGGQVIAANIETNPDLSTLRSQLASQASGGGDGASLIGYYDTNNNVPQTLNTFLNNLPTYIANLASSFRPGDMKEFAGTSIESGWLACNGAAVSRTTYAVLFAVIGTTWGAGDGMTTFNLPDFRRRTAVGVGGSGSATLGNAVGNTGGEETHTQTIAEMPAHAHTGSTCTAFNQNGAQLSSSGHVLSQTDVSQGSTTLALTVASQGGGTAFNVIQPSAVVTKIIKY